MALTTETIFSAIALVGQARFPGSQSLPKIARGVANAVMAWIPDPKNVQVQGVTIGVAGVGVVSGTMKFPLPGGPIVANGLRQAGVVGLAGPGTGQAVGSGLGKVLNASAQYQGASPGVGSGADTSKVVRANKATLQPLLIVNLQGAGINGPTATKLSAGLAIGISNLFLIGVGVGGVAGSASPVPAASTSLSVIS